LALRSLAVAVPGRSGALPRYTSGPLGQLRAWFDFLLFRFVKTEEMTSHVGLVLVNPDKWRCAEAAIIQKKVACPDYDPRRGARGA
jgi:hypothetical protein